MNLKELKHRILSVKGTQKITQAMKLVSSAKLRRAQHAIEGMRPYQSKLEAMMSAFLHSGGPVCKDYTEQRDVKRAVVIAVASDTGLCGAFNSNAVRLMRDTVNEYRSSGADVELYVVGQKMHDAARRMGFLVNTSLIGESKAPSYSGVASVANSLMESFKKGGVDRIEIVYTRFASASRLLPTREIYLPFNVDNVKGGTDFPLGGYIVEPGREELLHALFPKVIALHLYTALLDSVAAEHAARMIAMQTATDNADELITELTLEYNKGRQQAITNELLDIVAGSNL